MAVGLFRRRGPSGHRLHDRRHQGRRRRRSCPTDQRRRLVGRERPIRRRRRSCSCHPIGPRPPSASRSPPRVPPRVPSRALSRGLGASLGSSLLLGGGGGDQHRAAGRWAKARKGPVPNQVFGPRPWSWPRPGRRRRARHRRPSRRGPWRHGRRGSVRLSRSWWGAAATGGPRSAMDRAAHAPPPPLPRHLRGRLPALAAWAGRRRSRGGGGGAGIGKRAGGRVSGRCATWP
mmetsp:Transcript_19396/g.43973  ORF Transcript_19396/g.43973 Transcript_19396/m.43973 type:complete len:232 (+) Transcript_19396:355-1050(+)